MLDVPTYEFLEPRVGFSLPPRRDQRCNCRPLCLRVVRCGLGRSIETGDGGIDGTFCLIESTEFDQGRCKLPIELHCTLEHRANLFGRRTRTHQGCRSNCVKSPKVGKRCGGRVGARNRVIVASDLPENFYECRQGVRVQRHRQVQPSLFDERDGFGGFRAGEQSRGE